MQVPKTRKLTLFLSVLMTLVLVSGCTSSKETLKIAAETYAETQITAYMVKYMIDEHTDLKTEVVSGLGSADVIHQAMKSNEVQLAGLRYVGTELTGSLGVENPPHDPTEALNLTKKLFHEKFDATYFDPYGFENTYIVMMTQETAQRLGNPKTLSDIAERAKDLTIAVDTAWAERPGDGYPDFRKAYYSFKNVISMDINLVYKAVADGKVDLGMGYSTDGRIPSLNLHTLADDKKFFPPYHGAPSARNDILKKHPELKEVLEKLAGTVDTHTMAVLNYKVDNEGKEPADVAREFLKEKGLIK